MINRILVVLICLVGCKERDTSDSVQAEQQERILAEGTSQVGMPSITNFRERKLLKTIFELRDQAGLVTYTYLVSDYSAKLVFFCDSIGYGIPYSTQFTNPEKSVWSTHGNFTLPQADPNGLFSPGSADGTWVICKDPTGKEAKPVFIEPRIVVSPFKLVTSGDKAESAPSTGK